jgi:Xaa-Pro aminopeptidase
VNAIDKETFAARRRELARRVGDGSVVVVSTLSETIRNHDVHHEYRPDSNLWYLTGFPEPDAVLLIRAGKTPESVLFTRPRDKDKEVWFGRRAGPEGAVSRYGVDAAHELRDLDEKLATYLEGSPRVHVRLGFDPALDKRLFRARDVLNAPRRQGPGGPLEFVDPSSTLHEMRLVKGPEEIDALRRAAAVTTEAHRAAMAIARPGVGEHEIEAVIEYVFRLRGSPRFGYPTIVGSGANATILHYVENDAYALDGSLILVDAGCEIDGYTADVTRTFPANGRFSPAQRAIYEIVLRAQKAAIDSCRKGRSFEEPHDVAVRLLVEGFVSIGLLSGTVEENLKSEAYKRFYMHRTSHWLGLDVHDAGRYVDGGKWRTLVPGMALTIEPGCYVAVDDEAAPFEFRGIGVRVEDDVVVTDGDPEVLTSAAPKEVAEVEAASSTRARPPVPVS